ncbi:ABC transporter ATP-binding protein [Pedobacter ghigonis]|uniref:ABC transporter ATP-binding protein n=1 Tax=Pedobacter ghigonis TaxID=2730403 RepID=UPI001C37BF05|nr:ABC transporter ATP-binding protein [Pedobacter ghigonis]
MHNIAIKVENLSKAYQLGQIGTGTIGRDVERWYARVRGKEDPFLTIGEGNDQYTKSETNIVWSLKDISFEIEQGSAVGIIGRNGAGKSTLLKILSKITAPTTGRISGKGRIASLLEVGTGFHPELSGRENIFLNGTILGMRKKEIQRKLAEIIDFAGIERYIDTPVKRYSSGMYVRLAFAVAAHLESEILIVDEVLAVGDAEFQKKCLGKMGEVSKGEGRTVLFVSHNMGAINQLCNDVLLLENGKMTFNGNVTEGFSQYNKSVRNEFKDSCTVKITTEIEQLDAFIKEVSILNNDYTNLATDESLVFKFLVTANREIRNHRIGLMIKTADNKSVGLMFSENIINLDKGKTLALELQLNSHNLANGIYLFDFSIGTGNEDEPIKDCHVLSDALILEVTKKTVHASKRSTNWNSINWGSNNFSDHKIKIIKHE